jgi:hypothetical protein
MKVIKKEDVSNWSYQHTCKNCDSVLEVEASDLRYWHHTGSIREPSYDSYDALCPICNNSFGIILDDIPKLIRIEVKKRAEDNRFTSTER